MNELLSASYGVPELGTALLALILVAAGYTGGLGIAAGRGRPHLLQAARSSLSRSSGAPR